MDDDEVEEIQAEYANALVGRVVGENFRFEWLSAQLHLKWGALEGFRVCDLGEGCFLLKFAKRESRDHVLLDGPWHVAGRVVGLDVWSEKFIPALNPKMLVPTWVRLPGLPLQFWGDKNLFRIAAIVGEPLYIDAFTKSRSRTNFARICVRRDLSSKAPGCDGVTHSFFTHFWNLTMFDLCAAVKSFFANGSMEAKWKETLVVLIPKCSSPCFPEHYRPISLCSTMYKVVAKIIANRMKPVLQKLISEEQAAFVPARLISDNCFHAQEMVHRVHTTQSKSGYMVMKIDMEKAFDRIQWPFVKRALMSFNFPPYWINLIMECITHPKFGLLINGFRSRLIHATYGC
ncbi:hypothetical protein KSP39_PZI022362 [Platanthera zijinensis]|uniref:Reverse transcriptase n=1 Tax=Platanthera zijinensis TaxID=2320716 RepID=A0AAP0AUL0_9ASPA